MGIALYLIAEQTCYPNANGMSFKPDKIKDQFQSLPEIESLKHLSVLY